VAVTGFGTWFQGKRAIRSPQPSVILPFEETLAWHFLLWEGESMNTTSHGIIMERRLVPKTWFFPICSPSWAQRCGQRSNAVHYNGVEELDLKKSCPSSEERPNALPLRLASTLSIHHFPVMVGSRVIVGRTITAQTWPLQRAISGSATSNPATGRGEVIWCM